MGANCGREVPRIDPASRALVCAVRRCAQRLQYHRGLPQCDECRASEEVVRSMPTARRDAVRNFANLIENRFTGHWWGDDWEALWVNFWSQIAIGALMT